MINKTDWIGEPDNWRINGNTITKKLMPVWERLDWDRAWLDVGPSPAGNPGPYWHVPLKNDEDDIWHRLYPKIPSKLLFIVRQACLDFAKAEIERKSS